MELRLEQVTKRFSDLTAVSSVSAVLDSGVYGLLGVNGAGKTTLMRMLCTLTRPTAGQILWDGEDIFEMDMRYRKLLGYLPQDFGFYPDFSVQDYLMYVASLKGLRPAVARARTEEMLHRVGLYQVRQKKMKKFSGGMKRRAGIAQAVLNDPKLLILDEPTAGLDPNERIRFRNLIGELSRDRIVLLSTHIVSDVAYIAKGFFLMKDGQIRHRGSMEEILKEAPIKAWRCLVPGEKTDALRNRYQVANFKTNAGGCELRILSDQKPAEDAVEEVLTLEDVFLYYFGEKAEKEDAAVL